MRSRDSRRRRVMLDESKQANLASAVAQPLATDLQAAAERLEAASDKPRRLYGHGAQRRGQAKTTDLIPKRWLAYTALVTFLVVSVVTINALAFYAGALLPYVGTAGVAAFALQGAGTLASWYASLLMAGAGAACCQIYFLRKHRCDDYRGSYRIWSWFAIVFAVVSVGQSIDLAGIGGALIEAAAHSTGVALPALGVVSAATAASVFLFSLVALVCLWETRRSRGAIVLSGMAWAAGLVAILTTVPDFQDRIATADLENAFANGPLVFATCAFLAVVTYARYVYLAANGMLRARVASAENAPAASKPVVPAKPRRVTEPAKSIGTQPVAKPSVRKPAKAAAVQTRVAVKAAPQPVAPQPDAADPADANLSKAERRRQRKLDRRAGRAA